MFFSLCGFVAVRRHFFFFFFVFFVCFFVFSPVVCLMFVSKLTLLIYITFEKQTHSYMKNRPIHILDRLKC